MGIQKKHGKGRLDKWYKLAKEKNYRARSAFKLIQLNQKYAFLEKSKVLIDLCAAPGGWLQVASESMPASSLIIGVDLTPIKSIPKCITFVSDITTDKCRATLRQHLKTWKADTVLHDGAPNVGTAWVQDAFTQAELALQSLKLATEFLIEGGTFVTKVFRSKDYNALLWVFNQLFTKVEATKPPASRNVSAEIFVVCRGYKAPKKVDPKFLDPRSVFEELPDAVPNHEAKVFNPEKKKRKRDGYEEGDHLQFKEVPVTGFIETTDPIMMLGSLNKFSFETKDIATAAIIKSPATTEEIRKCCDDLRVLGRRDFKLLLRWRITIRDLFGLATKHTDKTKKEEKARQDAAEQAEIIPMDEELQNEEDLKKLHEKETVMKKKARRQANEKKAKEIVRMQLHMTAPTEIGLEQDANGGETVFKLKTVDGPDALKKIAKGKMNIVIDEDEARKRAMAKGLILPGEGGDGDEEYANAGLEEELDQLYEQYVERKAETDAKYRAKKARKESKDDEWDGFGSDKDDSSDEDAVEHEEPETDRDSSDDEDADETSQLITTLDKNEIGGNGLSKKAALFFDQDIFKDIGGLDEGSTDVEEEIQNDDQEEELASDAEDAEELEGVAADGVVEDDDEEDGLSGLPDAEEGYITESDDGIEIVRTEKKETAWDADEEPTHSGKQEINIITAEAMTLAQQLASGEKSKSDLMDDGFNRYSFRSKEGLPAWFIEEEEKHSRIQRPISAAGAAAIKEKIKAMNARPIKKVKEAHDRKKFKAHQRMEKLRRKSAMMAEDEGMTEKEKAQKITRMINRATKKKPHTQAKLVVARGPNRGISGRPKGTKGRYKIVDARLKKDTRGLKRAAKKAKH